MTSAVI